jgi:elongation factor G
VAVQLPIGQESGFEGVVDLMTMKAVRFSNEGREVSVGDVPADMQDAAKKAREILHEAIASADDSLLEKYLESGELSDEEARKGLAQGVRAAPSCPCSHRPALCASASRPCSTSSSSVCPRPWTAQLGKAPKTARRPSARPIPMRRWPRMSGRPPPPISAASRSCAC